MSLQFYDGGSFADCPFIQYPHGMGKQRAPAMVLAAAVSQAATSTSSPMEAAVRRVPGAAGAAQVSRSGPLASAYSSLQPSTSEALTVVPQGTSALRCGTSALATTASSSATGETAEETTARTAQMLQETLAASRQTTEVFDSHSLAVQSRLRSASNKSNSQALALTITAAGGSSTGVDGAMHDPGPIVRSPTTKKKSLFTDALLLRSGGRSSNDNKGQQAGDGGSASGDLAARTSASSMMLAAVSEYSAGGGGAAAASANNRKVVVPFCVSSWQNRKKLIVPVEQRLAQQQDDRLDPGGGIGDAVMDLAVAMQQASKEVAAELAEKERAKAEEEERRQAALEAAEAEKARQLLEQKAAELAAHAQRRETREQRMERIRLERELREQEKLAKQQQRLRERAATRLNITVEDLEADEQLLRSVEEASVYAKSGSGAMAPADPTAAPSAVISNEGIQREMQALAESLIDVSAWMVMEVRKV
ncbi:SKIP/SNW domain family protein [Leishmania donovani]|uniref:SKIP/SNW domain family protein n=1 Tax=Leishmania donovani TaxID=5661 RepID=A0A504XIW3_LEIDO|nr:SKIP/SNW domain family protein [Leishmania donovani]